MPDSRAQGAYLDADHFDEIQDARADHLAATGELLPHRFFFPPVPPEPAALTLNGAVPACPPPVGTAPERSDLPKAAA
jgi:hypothetical protein